MSSQKRLNLVHVLFLGLLELLAQSGHISKYGDAGKGNSSYLTKRVCDEFIGLMSDKSSFSYWGWSKYCWVLQFICRLHTWSFTYWSTEYCTKICVSHRWKTSLIYNIPQFEKPRWWRNGKSSTKLSVPSSQNRFLQVPGSIANMSAHYQEMQQKLL